MQPVVTLVNLSKFLEYTGKGKKNSVVRAQEMYHSGCRQLYNIHNSLGKIVIRQIEDEGQIHSSAYGRPV